MAPWSSRGGPFLGCRFRATLLVANGWKHGLAGAFALAAFACADAPTLPPLGEVVIVVDTDMPVPRLVDRLRVDVYSADGTTWLTSRDVPRATPSAWPVSFSVYTTDTVRPRDVLVRLRGYGGRYVDDYRGERFFERPALPASDARFSDSPAPTSPLATPECPDCPRLHDVSGADITPTSVPTAAVAIDRLALVHVEPGLVRNATVVLRGACAGSGADLAGLRTCVDTEGALTPVAPESLSSDLSLPKASQQGAFEAPFAIPCAGAPRADTGVHDADVCVIGGVFVFGSRAIVNGSPDGRPSPNDSYPERVVAVPSFYMDRYEFSVGRVRAAQAKGFALKLKAQVNGGPANDPSLGDAFPSTCTWSTSSMGRDSAPLNCVVQSSAHDLCAFYGGDLPTEAQWEYAATVAGRPAKTLTPPLDASAYPDCKGVAPARSSAKGEPKAACEGSAGFGTARVDYGEGAPLSDASAGLVGLGGNVSERTRDAFASLRSLCWVASSTVGASCLPSVDTQPSAVRGADWTSALDGYSFARRLGVSQTGISPEIGFRCVRSAAP